MGANRTKAQQKRFLAKQNRRWAKINRVRGILNNFTGYLTEQRFFSAFEEAQPGDLPNWLFSVKKSSRQMDREGVDAIAKTDCGKFFLQIKSSELRATEFMLRKNRQGIGVIVALKSDSPEYIRYQTVQILTEAREKLVIESE